MSRGGRSTQGFPARTGILGGLLRLLRPCCGQSFDERLTLALIQYPNALPFYSYKDHGEVDVRFVGRVEVENGLRLTAPFDR